MTKEGLQRLRIRSTPAIKEERMLESIISSSLRSLFGDCEPYSCVLNVVQCTSPQKKDMASDSYDAIIECPSSDEEFVRAAFTFPTIPKFLGDGEFYRLDVISSEKIKTTK